MTFTSRISGASYQFVIIEITAILNAYFGIRLHEIDHIVPHVGVRHVHIFHINLHLVYSQEYTEDGCYNFCPIFSISAKHIINTWFSPIQLLAVIGTLASDKHATIQSIPHHTESP